MDGATKPVAKKAASISVLRCLNQDCRGLLAYEVDDDNVLYVDLAWTARRQGELSYFPCPRCGGKNVVEQTQNDKGNTVHRVTRWQA